MTDVEVPVRRARLETFTSTGLLLMALALALSSSSVPARAAGGVLALYALLAVAWRLAGRDVLAQEGDELVLRRRLGPLRRESARARRGDVQLRTRADTSSGLFLMRPSDLGLGLGAIELEAGGRVHRCAEVDPGRARELVRRLR